MVVGVRTPSCTAVREGNHAAAYSRAATTSIAIKLEKAMTVTEPNKYHCNGPCENTG